MEKYNLLNQSLATEVPQLDLEPLANLEKHVRWAMYRHLTIFTHHLTPHFNKPHKGECPS